MYKVYFTIALILRNLYLPLLVLLMLVGVYSINFLFFIGLVGVLVGFCLTTFISNQNEYTASFNKFLSDVRKKEYRSDYVLNVKEFFLGQALFILACIIMGVLIYYSIIELSPLETFITLLTLTGLIRRNLFKTQNYQDRFIVVMIASWLALSMPYILAYLDILDLEKGISYISELIGKGPVPALYLVMFVVMYRKDRKLAKNNSILN